MNTYGVGKIVEDPNFILMDNSASTPTATTTTTTVTKSKKKKKKMKSSSPVQIIRDNVGSMVSQAVLDVLYEYVILETHPLMAKEQSFDLPTEKYIGQERALKKVLMMVSKNKTQLERMERYQFCGKTSKELVRCVTRGFVFVVAVVIVIVFIQNKFIVVKFRGTW
jgi:hypothetical protein